MKYYIKVTNASATQYAGYKACEDINLILEKNQYKPLRISMPGKYRKLSFLKVLFQYIYIFLILRKKDTLFIQYPFYTQYPNIVYRFILIRNPKIQLIIHDLNSLKTPGDKENIGLLKAAELIIAHTPQMKQYLQKELNLKNEIRIINLFDYLVKKECKNVSQLEDTLIYAGNLTNNLFLNKIKLKTYVYGNNVTWIKENPNLIYKGYFHPNDLSALKGDWGIIWYGNQTESCKNSVIGNYFKYISSHKASLYLAAGIPIIIWSM